jgi:hypothetical protein
MSPPTTGPAAVATPTAVPIHPNARPRLVQREELLDDAGHLGVDQAAGQALEDPPGDEHARRGREPHQGAAERERPDAHEQHGLAAAVVAEPATDDRDHPEGERVPRHDPLQLRGPGTGVAPDGRQGDGHDADVEQRREQGGHAHGQGAPAPGVELDLLAGRRRHRCDLAMGARVGTRQPAGDAALPSSTPATRRATSSAQPQESVKPRDPWP